MVRGGATVRFGLALAVPFLLLPVAAEALAAGGGDGARDIRAPAAADTVPDKPYYGIHLRRPGALPIGRGLGYAAVAFPENPFNVALTPEGYYVYDLHVSARGLRPGRGVHVLWLASPDLSHVQKVGVVERESTLQAQVSFDNKFVLFITEEASAEVERPTGRVVLRGISRSARMEPMFSHGG